MHDEVVTICDSNCAVDGDVSNENRIDGCHFALFLAKRRICLYPVSAEQQSMNELSYKILAKHCCINCRLTKLNSFLFIYI